MKKLQFVLCVFVFGCTSYSSNVTFNGIEFTNQEIQQLKELEELGVSQERVQNKIKDLRNQGKTDEEIKDSVLNIGSYGFGTIFNYIEQTMQEDKNNLYKACYDEYAKAIKTFDDRVAITKFCNCSADCVLENVKWHNNMPITLSENDEKDSGKVAVAWVELEKKCKNQCLKEAFPNN